MELSLASFDVLDFNFENKVQGSQKLEMETNVQYSVNVAVNRPQCRGEAWLTVQDKSPTPVVVIKLHAVGVFDFPPVQVTDEVKRQLHIGTFEMMYPYLSAQVACFHVPGGHAPLYHTQAQHRPGRCDDNKYGQMKYAVRIVMRAAFFRKKSKFFK
jgi:preprotein translocase subunit SecB